MIWGAPTKEEFRLAAINLFEGRRQILDAHLDFDRPARIVQFDDGAWVQGWVWVSNEEALRHGQPARGEHK